MLQSDTMTHTLYKRKVLYLLGILFTKKKPFSRDTKDPYQVFNCFITLDILPIYSQSMLATAGLDGKICLWDFPTHTFKKELIGHDKGVYSIDWS